MTSKVPINAPSSWWTLRNSSALAALVAAVVLAQVTAVSAQQAPPRSYVGVQALVLSGIHQDVAGSQRGTAVGALLQIRAGGRRVGLHLEGIPVVSAPQRASAFYGQSTPALGIANAAITYRVSDRFDAGVGGMVVNQRTPLPNISQVVSSRLTGARIELHYRAELPRSRFWEAQFGATPSLHGADHFIYSDGSPAVNKDERASEVDGTLALGRQFAHSEVLAGLRALNFSAQFTRTGAAADRNAGVGVMFEWRALLR